MNSDTPIRPTDEQLAEWSSEPWQFPVYYSDEHDQYLQGMAEELVEVRQQLARIRGLALAPFESISTIAICQALARRR